MSFWFMLITAFTAGIIGGVINYLLPANNPEPGKYLNPIGKSIVLGVGATFLVPLFLEIAQSKLMDNIHFEWRLNLTKDSAINITKLSSKTDTIFISNLYDTSTKKIIKRDTSKVKKDGSSSNANAEKKQNTENTGKNYLLWCAYCLLAAAAGFRFINMLINNVVKEEQINKVKVEKAELEKKKEELEKESEKRIKNSQISQEIEDQSVRKDITKEAVIASRNAAPGFDQVEIPLLPTLPPIIHPEDPQKGRFGGKSENNERKLSARVKESSVPNFYNVELVVETTNPANPLNTDVIFYIHDSFSPSVFTYKPSEFINGKAVENEILSYGAFTVGVITDNGKTLLELDLAMDESFPKEFRER